MNSPFADGSGMGTCRPHVSVTSVGDLPTSSAYQRQRGPAGPPIYGFCADTPRINSLFGLNSGSTAVKSMNRFYWKPTLHSGKTPNTNGQVRKYPKLPRAAINPNPRPRPPRPKHYCPAKDGLGPRHQKGVVGYNESCVPLLEETYQHSASCVSWTFASSRSGPQQELRDISYRSS